MELSSCKAEYIVALLCAYQVVWLMNLIQEMCNDKCDEVTLKIGNVSVVNLAKNNIANGRSKQIEM